MTDHQEPVLRYRTPTEGGLRRGRILQVLLDAHPTPLTFGQIATRMGVNAQLVATDMPRLIQHPCGMVHRGVDAETGRLAVLSLTVRGRASTIQARAWKETATPRHYSGS